MNVNPHSEGTPAERHKRYCEAMARFLSQQFGCEISSGIVSYIFERHWQRLSDLAHGIHLADTDMQALAKAEERLRV